MVSIGSKAELTYNDILRPIFIILIVVEIHKIFKLIMPLSYSTMWLDIQNRLAW